MSATVGGTPHTTYKFHVDQALSPDFLPCSKHSGRCLHRHQKMPKRDGEFEYYVESINEPHERIVRESQLREIPQLPKSLFLPKRQRNTSRVAAE